MDGSGKIEIPAERFNKGPGDRYPAVMMIQIELQTLRIPGNFGDLLSVYDKGPVCLCERREILFQL